MNSTPRFYGIIPARYDSSRFPGKPLAKILGEPMFLHVYRRCLECCELSQVILATDDERILNEAEKHGVPAVMTSSDHASGTDRVLEAARIINAGKDSVIVNIQGDEPALAPAMLSELISPFYKPEVMVSTLACRITGEEAENHDRVKVVTSNSGKALYFSRSPIPFPRDGEKTAWLGHIGLYAFRMKALEKFSSLGRSRLEDTEKLEQLRFLENDIDIHVTVTNHKSIGVDRPEDIKAVEKILGKS